ncbi:MAG: mandelate racemase/muconate lactonizing enzyme family protein [Chloroflexi bacterium]|nr:mandelate racemase/muconate lactonizing enzyme family protein [Chloroflexota bacterium]
MRVTDIHVLGENFGFALVEVQTDAGITGIGYTGSPTHIMSAIIEKGAGSLSALLKEEDPRAPARLWHKMFAQWQAQRGRGTEGGLAVNAMAAIDMALWDIAGKAQHLPVYKLLGGAVQPQIMAYASMSAFDYALIERDGTRAHKTPAQMAQEAQAYVSQGFKAVKYGWGNYFRPEDEEKLAAIREAIGPATRLMIDFGCPAYWTPGWNAKEAIRAARMLEKYDVYFFEEPMLPADVEGHAAVTAATDVKIATGESLTTIYEFQRLIERHAVDIVQPDAAQMGITQVVHVARRAEQEGILCVPHGPWSPLLVASHVNILATVSNAPMIEYPALIGKAGTRLGKLQHIHHHELIEHPPVVQDGYLQLPTHPGLGLGNFVPAAVAQLQAAMSDGK